MIVANFKQPMLADELDLSRKDIDGFVSRKIDGFRLALVNGKACTRSMKEPANKYAAQVLSHPLLQGLDGEVVVGEPNDPDVLSRTQSAMKRKEGEPDFTFWVFDHINMVSPFSARMPVYYQRVQELQSRFPFLRTVSQHYARSMDDLLKAEEKFLQEGYEGLMYRKHDGGYVCSRASNSPKSSHLLKLKRFMQMEAEIIDVYEEEQNNNEAFTDERGYTKRSSHQENKEGKGTLGGFICKTETGAIFKMGIGKNGSLTRDKRKEYWGMRDTLPGEIATFECFPYGMQDGVPRFPKFISLRAKEDIGG